jgi:hypothetical protein
LATHPGELVTRSEIQRELWEEHQFVEFEHAINVAVKKIRKTLQDDPEAPRYVETLPRKGYRFIAQVEEGDDDAPDRNIPDVSVTFEKKLKREFTLPLPQGLIRFLFLLIQVGYLALYCVTLLNVNALGAALVSAGFVPVAITLPSAIVIAMCGIAVRIYLLSEVGWAHPEAGRNFRRLFPFLLVLDALWAASPLLAVPAIDLGTALAGVAGLAYVPFAQRTLILSIYPPRADAN